MRYACLTCVVVVAVSSSGCTHLQLSRSALRQASTITDLEYKQVMSNLASYHCNPDVLPHFAVVGTGGTSITDQGGVNIELEWDAAKLVRELLGLQATREVEEQWTLAPVVNPDKLRAIKSVFQLVAMGHATDPEADELLKSFLGDDYMQWIEQGWYCVGGRGHVPDNACYVAQAGNRCVWVTRDGLEGLSRLTLVVLNIATLDPNPAPEEPTKTVEAYHYREDGKLDRIETLTRLDEDPKAPRGRGTPARKDFYNPLQTQIQLGSTGKRE
jgi:hypothetical protein